jgi:hypothetical protein
VKLLERSMMIFVGETLTADSLKTDRFQESYSVEYLLNDGIEYLRRQAIEPFRVNVRRLHRGMSAPGDIHVQPSRLS